MSTSDSQTRFDPRSILTGLQAGAVACVVIGGIARVARGSDEVTRGVDICPSLQPANVARLAIVLADMEAVRTDGSELTLDEAVLRAEPVVDLMTPFGELKLIAAPAGVPRGYEALRAGASSEHLGGGLRPEIASTGDLTAMSAALRRDEDLERMPALRRILELEADPAGLVAPSPRPVLKPGDAARAAPSHLQRARSSGRDTGPGVGR
jgi:hypothetical protein